MSKDIVKIENSGIGLSSILTIIFVVAKLMGIITWSWFVCFLPTIISLGIGLLIFIAIIILAVVSELG